MNSQRPLRPALNALLKASSRGLPIWTELRGYELDGSGVVIFYAVQPSIQPKRQAKASVRVSFSALEAAGSIEPARIALEVLINCARHQTLPYASSSGPAPLIALATSEEGLILYDPPVEPPADD